jgi:hypothetical protein
VYVFFSVCCVVPLRTKHIRTCFGSCAFRNGVAVCFTSQLFCEMSLLCYCATFKCLYLRLLHGCDSQLFQQHLTHCLAPALRHIARSVTQTSKSNCLNFLSSKMVEFAICKSQKEIHYIQKQATNQISLFSPLLSILVRVRIVVKSAS